ncbi:secretogranin-1 isoform X2 [Notothenia coriiceps]|uniref:Secretogranin-1 isoform X2 n=1 Tax=Notothenia coriiceps TaxID=8208 RepID=A0A6I9N9C7_9TELE|nr:PREDICTED: trichohyalin-like isoform X2 [Notothenia coriiceps]
MRLIYVAVLVAALLTENLALPVGKEGQREDVVTRCLVEVLSKALTKPDSRLDQECKDILQAGVKHAPLDKKSGDGIVTHGELAIGQPEEPQAKGTDVKDIEAFLKTVEEKREIPEYESSQESWSLGDEKEKRHENEEEEQREKRSGWRPGRYHQKKHKRDQEEVEGEEPEEERSQESWDVDKRNGGEDEQEISKRIWKPTHRYHHKKKLHKRGEEEEEGGERSQESWGLDKRGWRPGRYHQTRHRRDEELAEEAREEPDEERSQESWGLDKRGWRPGRYNHRWLGRYNQEGTTRKVQPVEAREEPEEERSQEYWDFDTGRDKREWRAGRFHQKRPKREEELSDGERSQESWGLDKRQGTEEEGIEKRIWKPTHRYHHKKKYHKRGEGSEEEEEEGEQMAASEDYEEAGKDGDDATRYLAEKRNPWIYRGFYHPAANSNKMDELAKLLGYKIDQLANQSNQEEPKKSMHQRVPTPREQERRCSNISTTASRLGIGRECSA